MKNKFEYEYSKDDFKQISNFIFDATHNIEKEEYLIEILSKIEQYHKNACLLIKEQDEMIADLLRFKAKTIMEKVN